MFDWAFFFFHDTLDYGLRRTFDEHFNCSSLQAVFSWQGLQVFFGCLSNYPRSKTKSASERKYLTVRFFFYLELSMIFPHWYSRLFWNDCSTVITIFFLGIHLLYSPYNPALLTHNVCLLIWKKIPQVQRKSSY